jgi:hypothetical protein
MEKVIIEYKLADPDWSEDQNDVLRWLNLNVESLKGEAYFHFSVAEVNTDIMVERLLKKKWCYTIMPDETKINFFSCIYYFRNLEDAILFKLTWG